MTEPAPPRLLLIAAVVFPALFLPTLGMPFDFTLSPNLVYPTAPLAERLTSARQGLEPSRALLTACLAEVIDGHAFRWHLLRLAVLMTAVLLFVGLLQKLKLHPQAILIVSAIEFWNPLRFELWAGADWLTACAVVLLLGALVVAHAIRGRAVSWFDAIGVVLASAALLLHPLAGLIFPSILYLRTRSEPTCRTLGLWLLPAGPLWALLTADPMNALIVPCWWGMELLLVGELDRLLRMPSNLRTRTAWAGIGVGLAGLVLGTIATQQQTAARNRLLWESVGWLQQGAPPAGRVDWALVEPCEAAALAQMHLHQRGRKDLVIAPALPRSTVQVLPIGKEDYPQPWKQEHTIRLSYWAGRRQVECVIACIDPSAEARERWFREQMQQELHMYFNHGFSEEQAELEGWFTSSTGLSSSMPSRRPQSSSR